MSEKMKEILNPDTCTGCTACASACPKGCITMTADENGFLFPSVDAEKCVSCGLCEKSCPIMTPPKTAEDAPKAYAAYSKDEAMRLSSSSGGIFTELARAVLQRGGVVFGAAYDEQFEVVHICAEKEAALSALRGAKYAQSDLRGVFAQVRQRLDAGQQVLFSGTPCQVGGLKAFLRAEHENLLTVDFVCHGVPSPVAWRNYVSCRAGQDDRGIPPVAVNLRSKETGWSRYRYSNAFSYADGIRHVESSGESLYMKLFVGDCINRASCADCRFKGYHRCSDLTIGDFWGIWDIAPEMDDDKGTSVVLVQSPKGAQALAAISGRLVVKPVALEEASAQNPSMLKSSPSDRRRAEALRLTRAGDFERCKELFAVPRNSLGRRILRKLGAMLP